MLNNDLYNPIKSELREVEAFLKRFLLSHEGVIPTAVPRIFNAGGKRLRPALLLLSSRMCDYRGDKNVVLAAMVEMIHTASLIHDDVIDNDTLRRGVPTINATWGNNLSIVLGDYLYTLVFSTLADLGETDMLKYLAATTNKMARGDLVQHQTLLNMDITEERYLSINSDKTASLISCACRIGAMLGKSANGEVDALARYGQNLGMAFQITDDLLDLVAEEKVLGKPPGSDIRSGKLTLPLIHVMREADKKDKEWITTTLKSQKIDKPVFDKILAMTTYYHGIEYSLQKAHEYGTACKKELKSLQSSDEHVSLERFVDYVVGRAG